ncbi:hypothetical protein SAMN04487893_10187 [Myroides guanonis]|uniref:Uncharacterized protein n=2 Tax=Myroides guanonis TaxID=1150112 RepID=A0A1I3KWB0_9FLAO|nr:hypothetical protein SAMN04487893_10187 [Myroides guanonis]
MKLFLNFLSPLSFWEKIALLLIVIALISLLVDFLLKIVKTKKNSKMLRKYLELKNEKWDVLVKILTDDKELDGLYVSNKLQMDLSNFDARYRDLIYHELLVVKSVKDINTTNYKTVLDLLRHKK